MVSQLEDSSSNTILLQIANDATYGSPQIQSIRNSKEEQIMSVPIPNLDSNEALGFDFMGVKREITIDGVFVGTLAEIEIMTDGIENIINGNQYNIPTFTHSLSGIKYKGGVVLSITYNTRKDYLVIIKSFSYTYDKGVPGRISYTLNMVEKKNEATQV